jgi:alkane 1-monooxygenase
MQIVTKIYRSGRNGWRRFLLLLPFIIAFPALGYPFMDHRFGGMLEIFIAFFAVSPLTDLMVGQRKYGLGVDDRALEYRLIPSALLVLLLSTKVLAFSVMTDETSGTILAIGMTVAIGLISAAIGIPSAHELIHRSARADRLLAEIFMCSISYPHYCIEHVFGHHRNVATPLDPVTARAGQSFYRFFFFQSLPGEFVSAWRIESARLRKRNIALVSPHNRMLQYGAALLAVYSAVGWFFGIIGVVLFVAQSVIAIVQRHVIDYVQHYGLVRREISPGVYERTGPQHSWNAAARASNAFLVNLGLHSDHHMNAGRPFQTLRYFDEGEAPLLPAGLPLTFLLALVPPLWFRVMDPRLERFQRARAALAAGTKDGQQRLSGDGGTGEEHPSEEFAASSTELPPDLRRTIASDRIDRFGGWIFAGVLVLGQILNNLGGLLLQVAGLAAVAIPVVAFRFVFHRYVAAEYIVGWAAQQPWNWRRLRAHGGTDLKDARRDLNQVEAGRDRVDEFGQVRDAEHGLIRAEAAAGERA